eukprot:scaffold247483_cov39-Tisochrysis_lutea.AAC.1
MQQCAERQVTRTRARLVNVTQDVSHASLVREEGREVGRLAAVILREGLHLAAEAASTLARQEAERSVARPLELPVRHLQAGGSGRTERLRL